MKGTVFNIQHYSVTDGEGIRTVVFFKGCQFRCRWCENPESLETKIQLSFHREKCISCLACRKVCPRNAITPGLDGKVDWAACDNCGICAASCMAEALEMIGKQMTVGEVMNEIRKDDSFYKRSNGGVTISGGEATMQFDFLLSLLQALKAEHYHVVLETNGNASWDTYRQLLESVDVFYVDLKGLNNERHKLNTGTDNVRILSNIRSFFEHGVKVVLRIPIIPGYNDSGEDIAQMDAFFTSLESLTGSIEAQLLPFHRFGEDKLSLIGTSQRALGLNSMTEDSLIEIKRTLQKTGRKITIGGS